ncbi:hypothetical protein OK016_28245 [Vibrio chagasii]|nr:hypothetical protein [Vibrio chagasii]
MSVISANKFYELQSTSRWMVAMAYGTDFLLMNDDFYQGLSSADRAIIDRAAQVAGTVGELFSRLTLQRRPRNAR